MAIIKVKRGTTTPTTSNLPYTGELAFNYSTNELYARGSSTVVKIGGEMEKVYYYEGSVSFHQLSYNFDRNYIYKIHVIAATNTKTADTSNTIINYLYNSSLSSGSYISLMSNDSSSSVTKTSNRSTSSFTINDSYSNSVAPTYAITKVIDFEISPTFESSVNYTYQWLAYGTSVTSVSDQSNAPITYTQFAHSIDASIDGMKVDPGLDLGTSDSFAIVIFRIKRK